MPEQNVDTDRYSMRGRVYTKLRESILAGHYKNGEELKEAAIGKELGVSRTPVREALRQLELEELVTIIPNKGAFVNDISEKDIMDIYAMRSYLEGLCARWACENMTEETLEELEEISYLSDFHALKGHKEQMVEMDDKFHGLIYKASGSRMLAHVLSDFHSYVHRVRANSLADVERADCCNAEHAAIVEAFKNHDPDRAEALAREHIINSMNNIKAKGFARLT